jgi:hypothetical protein
VTPSVTSTPPGRSSSGPTHWHRRATSSARATHRLTGMPRTAGDRRRRSSSGISSTSTAARSATSRRSSVRRPGARRAPRRRTRGGAVARRASRRGRAARRDRGRRDARAARWLGGNREHRRDRPARRARRSRRRRALWFHVDGAYGSFGVLDPGAGRALPGMERADSLTLDPHKWLEAGTREGCTASLLPAPWPRADADKLASAAAITQDQAIQLLAAERRLGAFDALSDSSHGCPADARGTDGHGYCAEGGSGARSEDRWRRLALSRTTIAGCSPPLA